MLATKLITARHPCVMSTAVRTIIIKYALSANVACRVARRPEEKGDGLHSAVSEDDNKLHRTIQRTVYGGTAILTYGLWWRDKISDAANMRGNVWHQARLGWAMWPATLATANSPMSAYCLSKMHTNSIVILLLADCECHVVFMVWFKAHCVCRYRAGQRKLLSINIMVK